MDSFLHIWPYLLVTIPLAVIVQMSGASKYIKRAFEAKPIAAILLATIIGAFSPFCSCGVIPVIASLLISGVPLAPVMSFWIASPSMDPEIFFLSVGMLGWELAIWRLAATLLLSLAAGFITQAIVANGLLKQPILRSQKAVPVQSIFELLKRGWAIFRERLPETKASQNIVPPVWQNSSSQLQLIPIGPHAKHATVPVGSEPCNTCSSAITIPEDRLILPQQEPNRSLEEDCSGSQNQGCGCSTAQESFKIRLIKETMGASWMVGKFMALAFLLEGLITFYVPKQWIIAALGPANPLAIITATILGVPVYTNSLTALPMISGLLTQGMNPAAAIAFLIAGPTTTLPAMAAVWPLVSRRVFVLYVSFSLFGAAITGFVYRLVNGLL